MSSGRAALSTIRVVIVSARCMSGNNERHVNVRSRNPVRKRALRRALNRQPDDHDFPPCDAAQDHTTGFLQDAQ